MTYHLPELLLCKVGRVGTPIIQLMTSDARDDRWPFRKWQNGRIRGLTRVRVLACLGLLEDLSKSYLTHYSRRSRQSDPWCKYVDSTNLTCPVPCLQLHMKYGWRIHLIKSGAAWTGSTYCPHLWIARLLAYIFR